MTLECKCHGVSGSCSVRTCWLAMADFRRTGDHLRRKYNGAVQVAVNQYGTGFTAAHTHFKQPGKYDLVYLEDSPDYCIRDQESGGNQIAHVSLHCSSYGFLLVTSMQTKEKKKALSRAATNNHFNNPLINQFHN